MVKRGLYFLLFIIYLAFVKDVNAENTYNGGNNAGGIAVPPQIPGRTVYPEYKTELLKKYTLEDILIIPFVYNGYLYSFSINRKCPLWRFFIGGDLENPFARDNGRFYFYDIYNRVYSVDSRSGELIWKNEVEEEITGSPIIFRQYVIIVTSDGVVYAFNKISGTQVFKRDMGKEIGGGIVIHGDRAVVAFKDGTLEDYDIENKTPVWKFVANGIISVPPAFSNGKLYFGTWDDNFYAIDAEEGSLIWVNYVGSPVSRRFLVFKKSVVLFLSDGEVLSLDTRNGSIKWVRYFRGVDFDYNYFKGKNKFLIISPELMAYDPENGNLIFTYRKRVFKIYKEMLFESMVEGEHFIGETERENLLREKYFVVNHYPLLPPARYKNYLYFIGEDYNLYIYDIERDFFTLKYNLERG